LALIVGPDEAARGLVGIKDLKSDSEQVAVARADVIEAVRARLAGG
jgi:hypothetical protein